MRLLLDENMSDRRLAARLHAHGHHPVLAIDVGLLSVSDAQAFSFAITNVLPVLTRDSEDFTDLHDLVKGAGGHHFGVIVVRFDNDPRHNTSENFRRRPGMYIGTSRFDQLIWWLRGYEFAQSQAAPNQPPDLDGFREWLHMKLDAPGNIDWQSIIASEFEKSIEPVEGMFEILDQFLRDVSSRGLDQILADHSQYEIRRYGSGSTSRLCEIGLRTMARNRAAIRLTGLPGKNSRLFAPAALAHPAWIFPGANRIVERERYGASPTRRTCFAVSGSMCF